MAAGFISDAVVVVRLGIDVYNILKPLISGWLDSGTGPTGQSLTPAERDALRTLVDQLEAQVLENARRDKSL